MAAFNFKFVRRLFPIILILAIHFMGPTSSEGASKEKIPVTLVKGQKLNQSAIHKDYQNGDFEIVLKDVADFQKLNKTYDIDDSIFIAKHLSVIYSADPATREKGKYWMHQLLNMMPSAQRLDMYVSEEIDRIFAKVQSEYIDARRSMGKPLPSEMEAQIRNEPMPSQRSAVRSAGSGKSKQEVSESKSNAATWWWVGGLSAAMAAGVTTYFLLSQSNAEPRRTIFIGDFRMVVFYASRTCKCR